MTEQYKLKWKDREWGGREPEASKGRKLKVRELEAFLLGVAQEQWQVTGRKVPKVY